MTEKWQASPQNRQQLHVESDLPEQDPEKIALNRGKKYKIQERLWYGKWKILFEKIFNEKRIARNMQK